MRGGVGGFPFTVFVSPQHQHACGDERRECPGKRNDEAIPAQVIVTPDGTIQTMQIPQAKHKIACNREGQNPSLPQPNQDREARDREAHNSREQPFNPQHVYRGHGVQRKWLHGRGNTDCREHQKEELSLSCHHLSSPTSAFTVPNPSRVRLRCEAWLGNASHGFHILTVFVSSATDTRAEAAIISRKSYAVWRLPHIVGQSLVTVHSVAESSTTKTTLGFAL